VPEYGEMEPAAGEPLLERAQLLGVACLQ